MVCGSDGVHHMYACTHALPWMKVFKEGGVIYLEVVTDRNKGKMDRTSYWGRRFETLCVLGVEGARLDELQRGPDDPPRPSYCALYRSRLGNHNILMGEEMPAFGLLVLLLLLLC